jgi:hypothetical protein
MDADPRIERFLAECAVMGGNLEADVADDGMSVRFRFAQARDRQFAVSLDEHGEPVLSECAE